MWIRRTRPIEFRARAVTLPWATCAESGVDRNEKGRLMKISQPGNGGSTRRVALVAALVATLVTAGVLALLVNIFERKQEARNPFYRVVDLDDTTEDPAIWGKNFPFQYDGYKRTVDQVRPRFGGSEAVPRTPTSADPRSVVAQSKLEADPRLKVMWAGYSFARDFREERGHAYMLDDQTYTERQLATHQPGTC